VVWLFEWWEEIYTWIENHRNPDLPATPLVAAEPLEPEDPATDGPGGSR
jgi:hypothetical protein